MSYTQRRTETRINAEKLIEYLQEHQPATVGRVVHAGVMSSRDAANALQYSIRHRLIERAEFETDGSPHAAQYRLTGRSIAEEKPSKTEPLSFDALLSAWGIAKVPPQLSATLSVRVTAFT